MFETLVTVAYHPDVIKLATASFLGAIIGLEREIQGKDPSLRTFALISLGSCLFTMASVDAALLGAGTHSDPGRIAAQIVTGIGFLGAGVIFRERRRVKGLTTAALIWVTASIGVMVGFGRPETALAATFFALVLTVVLRLFHAILDMITPPRDRGGME